MANLMGAPEVWPHPRLLFVRRKGYYLERANRDWPSEWDLVEDQRTHPAHCFRFVLHLKSIIYGVPTRPPVNSVSWAPHELGAILACASSDGRISVLTFKSTWHLKSSKFVVLTLTHRRWPVGR